MPLYYIRKINKLQWLCFKLLSVCVGIPIRSVYWRDLHPKLWKWKTAYVGELAGNHWSRIGKLGSLFDCSLQILAKKELLSYSVWAAAVHEGKLRDSAISYTEMLNTVRLLVSYFGLNLHAGWVYFCFFTVLENIERPEPYYSWPDPCHGSGTLY